MDDIKDIILQKKNIGYITDTLGTEQWLQISGTKEMNNSEAGFWCGLVDKEYTDELFCDHGWDISPHYQSCPGFEGGGANYQYRDSLLNPGFESIIYYREFFGVEKNYVELSQEFILLNNLRYDVKTKSYWAMYESGESEEAVKYLDETTVLIKMKFLRKYSAAKQMAIVLYFDIRTHFDGCLADYGMKAFYTEQKQDCLFYDLSCDDMSLGEYAYSVLMGKKIIMPLRVEDCGYWPFEKEASFDEFIIGTDEYGNECLFTCDPRKLANYFGANPKAPHYLTPVFFKREVLLKYSNKPELYDIGDGFLSCKYLWRIEIDNHHKDYVAVYLGDLGRDLPECERNYWKSFNVIPDIALSATAIQRDFLNIPAPSNMADHRFQYLYTKVSRDWKNKFGWPIFLSLSEEDEYNFTNIRIPYTDSQQEFDQLVLSLVKVIIDSLNEKQLATSDVDKGEKGIRKLEKWLESKGLNDYTDHISFLRDLQELRSNGTGHRKGKSYDKTSKKFCLDEKRKKDVYEEILEKANELLLYLEDCIQIID